MKWLPQSILKPEINIFQIFDIRTGKLLHSISNFDFYLFITDNYPYQCFQSNFVGCMKAYITADDYTQAVREFYG